VFGLGFQEIAMIFVVMLLVFGPKKLPELARGLGKSLAEFRRASNDLRRSIMEADTPAPEPRPPQGPADEVAAAALPAHSSAPALSVPTPMPAAASAPAVPAQPASAKPDEPIA
jgi:TatA/E family protein of Tat protein translocase